MTRYFTHYWTNETWNASRTSDQQLLDYAASNLFRQRGIQTGDYVYVVTVQAGLLYLLGAMLVGAVCDAQAAADQLDTSPTDLWEAADHLIAQEATPMNFDQCIPDQVARAIRFVAGTKVKPLFFRSDGRIDQQTLRGVRELTQASAQQLVAYHGQFQVLSETVGLSNQGNSQMPTTQSDQKLKDYYQSINGEFKSTKDRIRWLLGDTEHWLSDGEHKEAILRKILRQYVPEIMRVGTGFVRFPTGNASTQQDILITDVRKPTLFKDHDLTIVTPDAARALIEVKTEQTKSELIKTINTLAKSIANVRSNSEPDTRCFTGLFVYQDSGINPKVILQILHQAADHDEQRVIDFVAFGESTFIQFSHRPFFAKSTELDAWYLYDIGQLAPAYFISHIAWHLTEQRSQMNRQAYFPLGQSIIQKARFYLTLDSQNGIPQPTLNQ